MAVNMYSYVRFLLFHTRQNKSNVRFEQFKYNFTVLVLLPEIAMHFLVIYLNGISCLLFYQIQQQLNISNKTIYLLGLQYFPSVIYYRIFFNILDSTESKG